MQQSDCQAHMNAVAYSIKLDLCVCFSCLKEILQKNFSTLSLVFQTSDINVGIVIFISIDLHTLTCQRHVRTLIIVLYNKVNFIRFLYSH